VVVVVVVVARLLERGTYSNNLAKDACVIPPMYQWRNPRNEYRELQGFNESVVVAQGPTKPQIPLAGH
jgi:hypothetical protein